MTGLCILHLNEQLAAQKAPEWRNANLPIYTYMWLAASDSKMCNEHEGQLKGQT